MNNPRLVINLEAIRHNAHALVTRLHPLGISVCGVTKATLGNTDVASELITAGVSSLGESRIENVERLRRAGITHPIMVIRSPQLSQAARVVAHADISLNTEHCVIEALSREAVSQNCQHGIILMVELGDLREGIMVNDVEAVLRQARELPGITIKGIGANLACQSGVTPDNTNMGQLSDLAHSLEGSLDMELEIISGGNSANLAWALDQTSNLGRINHLRLGESILLGRETLQRAPIEGLDVDAFALVAEVIESKTKPATPWGTIGENAFGETPSTAYREGSVHRVIIALGRQDTDPSGLSAPEGFSIVGSSSDHIVLETKDAGIQVGQELSFSVTYSALLAAMTSGFVSR